MWDKKPNTITKVQNKIKGGKKFGENSAATFLKKIIISTFVTKSTNLRAPGFNKFLILINV